MRTGIDKAKSAEDSLWLGFKKLCPVEIFLSRFPFLFFHLALVFLFRVFPIYPNIPSYSSLSKSEKIRSENGITEKEKIVWLRVKKKKKKKRENAPL